MRSITKFLLILGLIGFVAVVGAGIFVLGYINSPLSGSEETVVFEVRPNTSFKATARKLEEVGLVPSARALEVYARVMGYSGQLRVGEYAIRRDVSPRELVSILTSGRSVEYPITIQEGLNKFEIAELLSRQGIMKGEEFLRLTRDKEFIRELIGEDAPSLEGYLFPETYHVTKFTNEREFIRLMVRRFLNAYEKLAQQGSSWNQKKMSRHELVTLASIIEKETGAPEERPVISSVFHNRLERNMRLQTDPTVIYGIWESSGSWNRNISKKDLLTPSRYNTYTFHGLPHGPISNPGFKALHAAGDPAETEYLFFVSRNDGTHIFSKDYAQHQRAVRDYQLNRAARAGKSWRDLQKREKTPEKVSDGLPAKN